MRRTRKTERLIILSFIIFTLFMARAPLALGEVPNVASDVYIDKTNNTLMVQKPNDTPKPFVIKGLSWSPATKAPSNGPNPLNPAQSVQYGFFFDWDGRNPQGHEVLNYWLKNQLSANYLTDIPLMKQMNVNTVRIYHGLGSNTEDYNTVASQIKPILDEFYSNGIMVIMTVAMSKNDFDAQKYLQVVNAYKNHPAILAWAIGNEWNLNRFYGGWTWEEAANAVNQAAQKIKAIDAHHPVASILGDKFDSNNIPSCPAVWPIIEALKRCPDIDLWGINVYRGSTFVNLFEQWKTQWQLINQLAKPFYISEFGIDSFNTANYVSDGTCSVRAKSVIGSEDQQKQAEVDVNLWKEIKAHLSAKVAGELCLGGLVHEFNDELWKVGNYNVGLGGLVDYNNPPGSHSYDDYNSEGFVLTGATPDNVLNEEYFGLVTAARTPKLAYEGMKKEWETTPPVITNKTISPQKINQTLIFKAQVTDNLSGVKNVFLMKRVRIWFIYYYQYYPMIPQGSGIYQGTLPASSSPTTITYGFLAGDNAGNGASIGLFGLSVVITPS